MSAVKYEKYVSTLSEELLIKAKTELNEDPETRDDLIEKFRTRVSSCNGLNARLDTKFLLRFLRAKKFDEDRAFKMLEMYYKTREENPDLFKDMVPSAVKEMIKSQVTGVLEHRDKEGRKIIVNRPGKWDPQKCPLIDLFKMIYLSLSKMIEEEETQINGVIVIVDFRDLGWTHAKNFSPFFAKKLTSLLQESFPARIKAIHYVHEPTFFDYIFLIVKQFMKEKIIKRLHFHGNRMKELHEFIDEKHLPEDYDGQAPVFNTTKWSEYLESCEDEFREDLKYGFYQKEAVSTKTSDKADAFEGVTGSFKKLEV